MVYEGDFRSDQLTGRAKLKWLNGDVYQADLLNGEMSGNGKFTWPNGTCWCLRRSLTSTATSEMV